MVQHVMCAVQAVFVLPSSATVGFRKYVSWYSRQGYYRFYGVQRNTALWRFAVQCWVTLELRPGETCKQPRTVKFLGLLRIRGTSV